MHNEHDTLPSIKDGYGRYVGAESTEPAAEPSPDYKKLFAQAMLHLRVVSGSRNSLTPEAWEALYGTNGEKTIHLRTSAIEAMHHEAAYWLREHEHLIPQDEPEEEN